MYAVIHDDGVPRHIPHQARPGVLSMGLQPLDPRHWSLQDKMDRPVAEIHNPNPGVHQQLTPRALSQ